MFLTLIFVAALFALAVLLRPTGVLVPTGRFAGVPLCTFLPTNPSGTLITLKGVKKAPYDAGISQIRESADADRFTTSNFADFEDPSIKLSGINPQVLALITSATIGTLVVTYGDYLNGVQAGGGGKTFTLVNASMMSNAQSYGHRQFGTLETGFNATSVDGVTSPLSVAAL